MGRQAADAQGHPQEPPLINPTSPQRSLRWRLGEALAWIEARPDADDPELDETRRRGIARRLGQPTWPPRTR